ncbi:hypothetical protein LF1_52500 [Rubripirellula obstinata]|uniref:Uncharacterized protein n=2 Tax=Rubripirellula obstinata TaxID=406547 RepID=A0A5B1CB25_9BACT|nr:hypothetical protein LF1_59080 [Rubripirellula obstinata]KAA1256966.1 hypothetical protein LF1_57470 [Rubripirellula obstinata]KAA1257401.1 hypothetical protein LF1_52500 [Rubripirellula obstinata]
MLTVIRAMKNGISKTTRRWIGAVTALAALAFLTPVIVDHLLRYRFNYAIATLTQGSIASIRFKPHTDREFVTISDPKVLRRIQEWLRTSNAPKAFYSYPPTSCPLEITLDNGNVEQFNISPTGMTATYIVELDADRAFERQRHFSYAMLSYNGYYRIITDQPFTPYLRDTNQLDPAVPKPLFMYGDGSDVTPAPAM